MSVPASLDLDESPDGHVVSAVAFVLAGRRIRLAGVAATSFVGGMSEALFLVLVTRAAFAITDGKDQVGVVAGRFVDLNQLILLGLLLLVVRLTAAVSAALLSTKLTSQTIADVRSRLSASFLAASWERQQQQRSGSLQELLTSYSGQAGMMMIGVGGGILAAANLAAFLALAVLVDPIGALVLVASITLLGFLLRPLRKTIGRRAKLSQIAGMEFATSLNEMSQLGLEVHVFNVQSAAQTRMERLIEQARVVGNRAGFASSIASPVYTGLAYVALLGALAVVSTTDSTSLTSLGAVMLVMLRSLSYGQALQNSYNTIAASTPAIEELQAQLASLEGAKREDRGRSLERVGVMEAVGVSFSYVPGQGVLRDVSFAIEPHEVVGIVGPSGGGKSTLVQLLLGLRDPDAGRILANGVDIGSYSKEEWARKVTFVPQSANLIAGSIADNIRFLRDGVTDADIEMAARLAHLHEDIIGFPERYERDVGEHGGHLSGGQQQRLCIARALVESPDLLILDEPTSALDVRSEHLVRTTLLGLKERMTVVVIAHRLTTLDICDRIMVIQAGELKAFDSPSQLRESSPFYREALELSGLR